MREAKYQSHALLSQMVWRFLIGDPKSSPWKYLLYSKYIKEDSVNPFIILKYNCRSFHIWRNLLIGWLIVTKFSKWVLGDGKTVKFWSDPWASSLTTPLFFFLHGPFRPSYLSLKVSDILNHGNWNIDTIAYPLTHNLARIIQDTSTPTTNSFSLLDTIFWTISSNGNFATASCYNALLQSNKDHPQDVNVN